MWQEYKDKADFKRTRMLEEEKAKVYHALAMGEPKPPAGAALEHVIEALWYAVIRGR